MRQSLRVSELGIRAAGIFVISNQLHSYWVGRCRKWFSGRRAHAPTLKELRSALGSRFPLWERVTNFIEKSYEIEGTWSTWGPAESGWNLRYRRSGKSLAALYPQRERILVQIVLGKVQAERALQLKLKGKVLRMLQEAPQLRDGRWLFIPVTSESDVKDVEKLLLAKIRPPRKTCTESILR